MLSSVLGELQKKLANSLSEDPDPKFSKSINIWISAALRKMGVDPHTNIVWIYNYTLTEQVGRARFLGIADKYYPTYIEFSPHLFEKATSSQRRQVVYHEIAHVVDCLQGTYNPRKSHGKSWKRLMHMAGVPATRHYYIYH